MARVLSLAGVVPQGRGSRSWWTSSTAVALVALLFAGCAAPPGQPTGVPATGATSGLPSQSASSPAPSPSSTPAAGPDAPTVPTPPGPAVAPGPAPDAMRFGLDVDSLELQAAAGLRLDYATIWIGVWNLEKGWLVPEERLAAMRAAGVTPAVQLYYWGDDMSPSCFETGCNGKTVEGWDRLARELVDRLQAGLDGGPALLILETEFNKASVARYEPLDALLAEKAAWLKGAYPAARIVLGFGDWNLPAWETWDRAAAASDAMGLQALAGASGHGAPKGTLFEATLAGAQRLHDLYGKPVVLGDVAVASAPDPATPATQAAALDPFLGRLDELRDAGVEAILYRSLTDSPGVPLGNFFGEAERHFGLATAGGALKPAGEAWLAAIRSERGDR